MTNISMMRTIQILIFISSFLITLARVNKCCHQQELLANEEFNVLQLNCQTNSTNGDICLDKTKGGSIVALKYDKNRFIKHDFDLEYKCCPQKSVYNIKTKNCERRYSDYEPKNDLKVGIPHCKGTVLDVSSSNLSFTDGVLTYFDLVSNEKVAANLNESCVDITSDYGIVLRTCVHQNVCEEISCVKKCCPNGQVYFRTTGRAKCASLDPHFSFEPHHFREDTIGK